MESPKTLYHLEKDSRTKMPYFNTWCNPDKWEHWGVSKVYATLAPYDKGKGISYDYCEKCEQEFNKAKGVA